MSKIRLPKISVIIPHHNNYDILYECLSSLIKCTYKNFEIIIVDNNSNDGSIKRVKNVFNEINVYKSEINLGYSGGCNAGAKIATGEYLLFLNNDTIHNMDFMDHLVSKMLSNDKIACIQPKIKNFDKREYFDYAGASGGFIDYLGFPFARGRIFNTIEKDMGQYNDSIKVFWTSGTAFITKKNIFDQLNGFDEKLFAHMEEIDYCWKCYLAGYECWVEPHAEIFHHGGKTLSFNSPKKTYLNHRNSFILILTNYNLSLSLYLLPLRLVLEFFSSLSELLKFRLGHFLAHYVAILSIIFNFSYLINKRNFIKKIRKLNDKSILEKGVVLNESIIKKYYFYFKNKYSNLF